MTSVSKILPRERVAWMAPLIVAAISVPLSLIALWALTYATLGRDQGIFQYVAWAEAHGERAYRDFHEINGPLPHAYHALLQLFGGADEHVFRSIDTCVLVVGWTLCASTLPEWLGVGARWRSKCLWALAGLGLLGAQYVRFDWWHTSQRENLYSILVFASLAFQALGHVRKTAWYWAAAGLFTTLTWFGKPLCVVFALIQLAVLVADRAALAIRLRTALVWAVGGGLAAAAIMFGYLVARADLHAMIDMLVAVPRLHHTIWNESLVDCYHLYGNAPRLDWAAASVAAFVACYFVFDLPRRSLLVLVLPLGGFAVFIGQAKGFPYHLHMTMLGAGIAQLAVVGAFLRSQKLAPLALIVGTAFAVKAMDDTRNCSYMNQGWPSLGATPALRQTRVYFDSFPWGDFFPGDLRDAAAYLKAHTKPDDRVQVYGMDPYLLFLAERRSGTPILYSFELDVDPALAGGSGAKPSEADKVWLRAYRDRAERAMLAEIRERPPAAFVFMDDAPFAHAPDGERAFAEHCPDAYAWVDAHYGPTVRIGRIRIRLLDRP